jgi:hypothetical protein
MVGLLRTSAPLHRERGRERNLRGRPVRDAAARPSRDGQLLLRHPALPLRGEDDGRCQRQTAQPADLRRHRPEPAQHDRRRVPGDPTQLVRQRSRRGSQRRRGLVHGPARGSRPVHRPVGVRHRQPARAPGRHGRNEARSGQPEPATRSRRDPRCGLRRIRRRGRVGHLGRVRRPRHGLQREAQPRHLRDGGVRRPEPPGRYRDDLRRLVQRRRFRGPWRDHVLDRPHHEPVLRDDRERRDGVRRPRLPGQLWKHSPGGRR